MEAAAGAGTKADVDAMVKPRRLSEALHPCPQMPTDTWPETGGLTMETAPPEGRR
jgi:hypothetical protein